MSIPAVEPHSLPSGSSPQFAVTVGFGFGSPSPVIGLPMDGSMSAGSPGSAAHPIIRALANSVDIRTRDEDMVTPLRRIRSDLAATVRRDSDLSVSVINAERASRLPGWGANGAPQRCPFSASGSVPTGPEVWPCNG